MVDPVALRQCQGKLVAQSDPVQVQQFAQAHDERLWQCLCQLLGITVDLCDDAARSAASFAFSPGRTGFEKRFQNQDGRVLGELGRLFADDRSPISRGTQVIAQLEGHPHGHSLRAVANAANCPEGVRGFEVRALVAGLRPSHQKSSRQGGSTKLPPRSNRNTGKPCSE